NYTYVSGRLVILGSLMDTSASDGTTMDDWFEATKSLVSDVGFSIVGYKTAKGLQGINPHQLADQMRLGAIVLPVVGWYDQISGDLWDRDGGHMLTMFA